MFWYPALSTSNSPAFNPASQPAIDGGGDIVSNIANLSVWYDAADITSVQESAGAVSQWNDKSGNANHLVQTTASNQPTYTSAHVNGLNVVTFDGGAEEMDFTSTLSLTGEYTIFIVANTEDVSSTRTVLGNSGANNKVAVIATQTAFYRALNAGSGDSTVTYPDISTTNIETIKRDSSDKVDLAFNGADYTRLFSDVAQSGTTAFNRLGVDDGTFNWQGDVCEVIIYSRSLTDYQRASVELYLSNKWGIPITAPLNIPNLELWFDPADTSSISDTSGAVDQINDKSGNGRHGTNTGSNRPTTNATTVNGRNVLDFDSGSDQYLDMASAVSLPGAWTIFVVLDIPTTITAASAAQYILSRSAATYPLGTLSFGPVADGFANEVITVSGFETAVSGGYSYTTADVIAGQYIFEVSFDGSSTTSIKASKVGEPVSEDSGGITTTNALTNIDRFGTAVGSPGLSFDGSLMELLIYSRDLNANEEDAVYSYLSNKWGIPITAPLNIPDLVLWLDASDSSTITEDGGSVSQWDDKSGNGNNVTQGTEANQPTYSATSFNGMPGITPDRFDYMDVTVDWNEPCTIISVQEYNNVSSGYVAWGENNIRRELQCSTTNGWSYYDGSHRIIAATPTDRAVVAVRLNNTTNFDANINGTEYSTITKGSPQAANVFRFGNYDNANAGYRNAIAEQLLFTRDLTDAEITAVVNYLMDKWSIS